MRSPELVVMEIYRKHVSCQERNTVRQFALALIFELWGIAERPSTGGNVISQTPNWSRFIG
jgi:hypothetical protein